MTAKTPAPATVERQTGPLPSLRGGEGVVSEPLRSDIVAAIHGDEVLTREQLRALIAWEAGQLGLSYPEALAAFQAGALPRTALGSDVDLLFRMLGDGKEDRWR